MKDRLREFIDTQDVSITKLEAEISVARGTIARFLRGDGNFSAEILVKISERYPEINIDWLVTGRGSMLYNNNEVKEDSFKFKDRIDLMEVIISSKNALIDSLQERINNQSAYLEVLTNQYIQSTNKLISITENTDSHVIDIAQHLQINKKERREA